MNPLSQDSQEKVANFRAIKTYLDNKSTLYWIG